MPIYTYRCENCGIQFDRQQRFDEDPLVRCPECEKDTIQKVYLPVGIVFKGSGFYATDHRSPSGQSNRGKSESKESSDTGSTSDSDSKSSSKDD